LRWRGNVINNKTLRERYDLWNRLIREITIYYWTILMKKYVIPLKFFILRYSTLGEIHIIFLVNEKGLLVNQNFIDSLDFYRKKSGFWFSHDVIGWLDLLFREKVIGWLGLLFR